MANQDRIHIIAPRDVLPTSVRAMSDLRADSNLGVFFERSERIAADLYFSSRDPRFLKHRQGIEGGVDSVQLEAVVRSEDFGNVPPTDGRFDRLFAVASLKHQIFRKLVGDTTRGSNNLGLKHPERIVLAESCGLATETDFFYSRYVTHLRDDPAEAKIKEDGEMAHQILATKGLTDRGYVYGVFVGSDSLKNVSLVSYAQAFSEPVKGISAILTRMNRALSWVNDVETLTLVAYYQNLKRALTSEDLSAHEVLWQRVDLDWLKVSGRMQPVHMMESYLDPLRLRVEPDFALVFPDDRYPAVIDQMGVTREGVISYLTEANPDSLALSKSIPGLENSRAMLGTGLRSAARLHFRPAGQNVPNREGLKHLGAKIFEDRKAMEGRWLVQRKLLVRLFGESEVAEKFGDPEKIVDTQLGIFVAGHEVSHTAFRGPDTRVTIGAANFGAIEEHKANMSIISAAPAFLDGERLKLFIKAVFAEGLRHLGTRGNNMLRPYYNSALFNLGAMMEAGILEEKEGEWSWNDSGEKLGQFFDKYRRDFKDLVEVYEQKSPDLAISYIDQHFTENPQIKKLLNKLGIT